MKTFSAREAKYNFGRMIDAARSEPVMVEKHGRSFVVVLAAEEYGRLINEAGEGLPPGFAMEGDESSG